ncbi:hypothetical protein [Aureivirga marina]|uniref:hypothetical protein n=1 Tax=Aureivirga marina TaxID=1182451 RepID=UPI0018CAE928|nr:hypothetical protein [Aureivirga marina]
MKKINLIYIFFALFIAVGCSDNEDDSDNYACQEAEDESLAALAEYESATEEDEGEKCAKYKIALESQLQVCGDNEAIKTLIANLENCGGAVVQTCEQITSATLLLKSAYDGVSPGDADYQATCLGYKAALEQKKAICGDDDGAIQTIINSLNCDATE